MPTTFHRLRGEQLSAVTFVQDYLQLDFDGLGFSVYTPVSVHAGGISATSGDEHFRNALCAQIAKKVADVSLKSAEALVISFEDGSRLSISLRPKDYTGVEAFQADGFGEFTIVHRIDD